MVIFDIIIGILFLWAIYTGFKSGIVVQLGGLAGLFIGTYLAFRFGLVIGEWLGLEPHFASITGFIIVLIAVIILIAILGKILKGVFRFAGLGMLDKLGGLVLSIIKMGLILSLLLYSFDCVNRTTGWVDNQKLQSSRFYYPLVRTTDHIFPYIDFFKDKILPQTT